MEIPNFDGWAPEEIVAFCEAALGTRTPEEIKQYEENRAIAKRNKEKFCKEQYEKGRRGYYKRTCPTCGTVFYTDNARRIYDDYNKCSSYQHNKRAKIRRKVKRRTVCAECGEPFTPQRAGAKYCCSACRQKAYRERKQSAENQQAE